MSSETIEKPRTARNKDAPAKFRDPRYTVKGEPRGAVPFDRYQTVWFNTGTLCNIACHSCYIESSPRSDQLVYLSAEEVAAFLDEAAALPDAPGQIGFTGGEPFMNPDILIMIENAVRLGFHVLVLTNGMRPMQRHKDRILDLRHRYPRQLSLRLSLDYFEQQGHEAIRGPRTWAPAIAGLKWLAENGFDVSVASRKTTNIPEGELRQGYARLFKEVAPPLDAFDPARLVLFPEMNDDESVPEISEGCWKILGMSPRQVMCASSRMVIKRKGAQQPVVVACTLIPYNKAFELGETLDGARATVTLNHRHCSRFCVLGKASCVAN